MRNNRNYEKKEKQEEKKAEKSLPPEEFWRIREQKRIENIRGRITWIALALLLSLTSSTVIDNAVYMKKRETERRILHKLCSAFLCDVRGEFYYTEIAAVIVIVIVILVNQTFFLSIG